VVNASTSPAMSVPTEDDPIARLLALGQREVVSEI
jgi:hypothetical protein